MENIRNKLALVMGRITAAAQRCGRSPTDIQLVAVTKTHPPEAVRAASEAGAYAIQGLGTFLVKRVNGSYTNVVGLPVCEVIELLIREGVVQIART